MLVRDKMTRDVIAITLDHSLRMARECMRKHSGRRLPVVRDGKLVGIATDRDIHQAWASPATCLSTHELLYLLDRVTVEEVMRPQPLSVTPEASLLEAARLLHNRRIGGLPVVEGGSGRNHHGNRPARGVYQNVRTL